MKALSKAGSVFAYAQEDAQERFGIHNFLHIQDQKPSGTAGGTFTSGAWRTRDLNTIIINNISGASITTNQITIPAGTYYCVAVSVAVGCGRHQLRVQDITGTATKLLGVNSSNIAANYETNAAHIGGAFTLSSQSIIELQHIAEATYSTTGFGLPSTFGLQVYSDLKIWKVA